MAFLICYFWVVNVGLLIGSDILNADLIVLSIWILELIVYHIDT